MKSIQKTALAALVMSVFSMGCDSSGGSNTPVSSNDSTFSVETVDVTATSDVTQSLVDIEVVDLVVAEIAVEGS